MAQRFLDRRPVVAARGNRRNGENGTCPSE